MKNRFPWPLLMKIVLFSLMLGLSRPPAPMSAEVAPGETPLGEALELRVGPSDRCPVCAMAVAKHPKFASAIQLKNGATYYFCGTGCMIKSWIHPETFLGVSPDRLSIPVIRDYFSGRPMDARAAVWAAGSDVVGPMGPALVPLASEADLAAFRRRHGATTVFRLEEMDDDLWRRITGKPSRPQAEE